MPSLSQQLGHFAHQLDADALSPALQRSIRARVIDVLGLACAAQRSAAAPVGLALADNWGARGRSRVMGGSRRVDATGAAFVNAVLANCEDFDDTHLPSILHPSATIIPTALAVAEEQGRSVAEFLAAAAVGYELCIRLGMAAYDPERRDSIFFARGWHATSICGALGATASAAKLMGMDGEGIADALAVAASLGSGILEANRGGGSVKAFHCGYAAQSAIFAARNAKLGVTGPAEVLEGEMGLFRAFCGIRPAPSLTAELGRQWSLDGIVMKRFPVNHFLHPVVDGARELRAANPTATIDRVVIGLPGAVLKSVAEPRALKLRPASGYASRFSAPFVFASAWLCEHAPVLADFGDDAARNEERLALAARVQCEVAPSCDRSFPERLSATLQVHTADGRVLETEAREGPSNEPEVDALLDKLRANLEHGACEVERERVLGFLEHGCASLDQLPWPVARSEPRAAGGRSR